MKLSSIILNLIARRWDAWFFFVLLAASLALNVYLGLEIQRLPHVQSPTLSAGARVPKLYAEDLGGAGVTVDWAQDSRPTLLYIFSPSCIWCQRNLKNFEAVVQARRADFRIIGLSVTSAGLKSYLHDHAIEYPVYVSPDPRKNRDFTLNGTPTTLVIFPDGTVKEAWHGAYSGKVAAEVEARLRVKLPGLVPVENSGLH